MIEAILWRHRYLEKHPQEQAVIVTTGRGNRILSATTIYTEGGRVYGSSNALGEHFPIRGLTPADLGSAAGITRATKYINDDRQILLDGARPLEITSAPRSQSRPDATRYHARDHEPDHGKRPRSRGRVGQLRLPGPAGQ